MKFPENPPSGSRVVLCGLTEGQTDVTKLIVTFRISANSPKNSTGLSFIKMDETDVIFWSADDTLEL